MVLYNVHSESSLDKYYSTVLSKATLFQIVVYSLMIFPPFFIAYSTNDFWHYTSSYREQSRLNYSGQLIVQVGGSTELESTTWSSFENDFSTFSGPEPEPTVTFEQTDSNQDGHNDVLRLSISFNEWSHDLHTVQLFVFFVVELNRVEFLQQFASVRLQSLAYSSHSWASPASSLWLGGELELIQREPFPASGVVDQYDISPLNVSSTNSGNYNLSTILRQYNERNARVSWDRQYPVWTSGANINFTITMELRYPAFTVSYYPSFWQYLKFSWVQYLALLVLFWWVLRYAQSFVFENQLILTVRKERVKVHFQ